jgi:hypothetical protein
VLRTERPRRSCLSSAAATADSGLPPDLIVPRPNPRRWDEALSSLP